MLSSEFIDWWFEPWRYAKGGVPVARTSATQAGMRDGYRIWCEQARVAPDLPRQFDPAWQVVVVDSAAELLGSARLFAGLIAARQHDTALLNVLAFDDRKWCISVAATQPLIGCHEVFMADDPIELRGLCELARRMERGFPGIWARLQLMLTADLAASVAARMEAAGRAPAESSATRAQRCWSLCLGRTDRTNSVEEDFDEAACET